MSGEYSRNDIHSLDRLDMYFDGACIPTSPGGICTYGWSVTHPDTSIEICYDHGKCSEANTSLSTCNYAEWCGLLYCLSWLVEQKWKGYLRMYGDSQLVIEQVSGRWRCHKEHLRRARDLAWQLLDELSIRRDERIERGVSSVSSVSSKVERGSRAGRSRRVRNEGKNFAAFWLPRERNSRCDYLSKIKTNLTTRTIIPLPDLHTKVLLLDTDKYTKEGSQEPVSRSSDCLTKRISTRVQRNPLMYPNLLSKRLRSKKQIALEKRTNETRRCLYCKKNTPRTGYPYCSPCIVNLLEQ